MRMSTKSVKLQIERDSLGWIVADQFAVFAVGESLEIAIQSYQEQVKSILKDCENDTVNSLGALLQKQLDVYKRTFQPSI
jgi:hypothetical protein